jgi:hypothetical protein
MRQALLTLRARDCLLSRPNYLQLYVFAVQLIAIRDSDSLDSSSAVNYPESAEPLTRPCCRFVLCQGVRLAAITTPPSPLWHPRGLRGCPIPPPRRFLGVTAVPVAGDT